MIWDGLATRLSRRVYARHPDFKDLSHRLPGNGLATGELLFNELLRLELDEKGRIWRAGETDGLRVGLAGKGYGQAAQRRVRRG